MCNKYTGSSKQAVPLITRHCLVNRCGNLSVSPFSVETFPISPSVLPLTFELYLSLFFLFFARLDSIRILLIIPFFSFLSFLSFLLVCPSFLHCKSTFRWVPFFFSPLGFVNWFICAGKLGADSLHGDAYTNSETPSVSARRCLYYLCNAPLEPINAIFPRMKLFQLADR